MLVFSWDGSYIDICLVNHKPFEWLGGYAQYVQVLLSNKNTLYCCINLLYIYFVLSVT